MIGDINEDEIFILGCKLDNLFNCLRIKKIGYGYQKGKMVNLLTRDPEGYYQFDDIESFKSLAGTSLGYGWIEYAEDVEEEIKSIGAVVPKSKYHNNETMGIVIKIDNEETKHIISQNIQVDEDILNNLGEMSDWFCIEESTINEVQAIIDRKGKEGIYIIIPSNYIDVEYAFSLYCDLLEAIYELVNNKEEELDCV